MLAQGVIKYLLTVGILLQQGELIERPDSEQDDRQQPDLRIEQPAPERPDGKMTDGLAGQQQTKRQRQPQAAAGRGARQRRAMAGELKRRPPLPQISSGKSSSASSRWRNGTILPGSQQSSIPARAAAS